MNSQDCTNTLPSLETLHGVIAARGVHTAVNTRLTKGEVDYILEHSGAKIILVDHEYVHLVKGTKVPVIISKDSGTYFVHRPESVSLSRVTVSQAGSVALTKNSYRKEGSIVKRKGGLVLKWSSTRMHLQYSVIRR